MKQNDIQILPVQQEEDIRIIAGLAEIIWHECYNGIISHGQILYMLDKFQSLAAMQAQIEQQHYEYYLVMQNDKPVGYFAIVLQADGSLFLSKIYTLAAVRGSGVAPALFAYIEAEALKRACPKIWLTVNRDNARAAAAYQKNGYTLVREQVSDIGSGYVMDDYVFEKQL